MGLDKREEKRKKTSSKVQKRGSGDEEGVCCLKYERNDYFF